MGKPLLHAHFGDTAFALKGKRARRGEFIRMRHGDFSERATKTTSPECASLCRRCRTPAFSG
jgi:hypothetical protein